MNHNTLVTWVEIPANDFDRAVNFYQTIVGPSVSKGEFMGMPHGFFNLPNGNMGGAVIPNMEPKLYDKGPLVYISVDDLDDVLKRVIDAGGSILLEKTAIGPQGFIAAILDTEGNRVGLHMMAQAESL